MTDRPFAVFDIDGTVIRWQLYHALGDALAKRGVIDENAFRRVRDARMSWKRRSGQESFSEYENHLVRVFDAALPGMETNVLADVAQAVFGEYKDQVYTYSRDLIRRLKQQGCLLFAISGSPAIIVKKLANYYGFDDFVGTTYPAENERFTGAKDLVIGGKKSEILEQLVKKHRATFTGSIGLGDTEGDVGMLELVEQPIVFNPTKKLFQHAQDQRWKIVIERKNMVYELEPGDGKYKLKN